MLYHLYCMTVHGDVEVVRFCMLWIIKLVFTPNMLNTAAWSVAVCFHVGRYR